MEESIARQECPIWTASDWREIMEDKEPVRIYRPKSKKQQPVQPARMKLTAWAEKIRKKYGATLLAASALVAWTLATCGGTAAIVRHSTTEKVTASVESEQRAGFMAWLDEHDIDPQTGEKKQRPLVDEESQKAAQEAMDAEAESLAKLLYGYRNNSLRDRKTLVWCVLARVDSTAYPGSVESVITQKDQWMFYSADNPVRTDDKQIAAEELQLWHDGKYPDGFSDDYVYAEWKPSRIRLFDNYEDPTERNYWRFPE